MTRRQYLQTKTRNPAFLWRMVIGILAVGAVGAMLVEGRLRHVGLPGGDAEKFNAAVDHLDQLAAGGDWAGLWWGLPEVVFHRISLSAPTALAAFAGCWWFAFCMQAAQVRGVGDPLFWLLPLAVVLGGLSIWPTHFLGRWMEHRWGVHDSNELIEGLRHYILGVGLPEEAAKLLCFLPLVPFLLRIRSDLAALMTAGCVGLGFAVAENINYFRSSRGIDALGRFLTANPAHIALTGIAGLAAYRAIRDLRGWGANSLAMIALMVFAHGLYDAAIGIPELADVSILGTIVFALVVYQFFRELRDLRPRRVEMISLTATFLAGVATVTAAMFIYVSGVLGFQSACDVMATEALSLSLMAYLFLREMPETMVSV
jgi:RsiW-degrading membrane proteinase PrsW (M82 family)